MLRSILVRWLRRKAWYAGKLTRIRFYPEYTDLPDIPRAKEITIAGSPELMKWLRIDCPCGEGHIITLPLSKDGVNQWAIDINSLTVRPSIDRHGDRRCHFWIQNGEVRWV